MNTHVVYSTASTLAGPGTTTATFIPAPGSTTSTVKAAQPTTHRPNKADLELILFRAQVRTHHRRLRESLGHGLPSGVPQRTTRAAAHSYPTRRPVPPSPSPLSYSPTPSPTTATTTTDTEDVPVSPIYVAQPLPAPTTQSTGRFFTEAPSPSLLPTPFESPVAATRPSLVQSGHQYGPATMGRRHSFVTDGDPPLTPGHVFPPNLRRTPGAPVWVTDDTESYFQGPVGLGLNMDINVNQEERIVVEHYCFGNATAL